jgi:copper chaperone CopZ
VQQVEASYKTQRITLTFDPQSANLERIRQELDWIGYRVAEAEEE